MIPRSDRRAESGDIVAKWFAVEADIRYAAEFDDAGMDARPVLKCAVVACRDARLDDDILEVRRVDPDPGSPGHPGPTG